MDFPWKFAENDTSNFSMTANRKEYYLFAAVACSVAAVSFSYCYVCYKVKWYDDKVEKLEADLEKQKKLRQDERNARINSQKQSRKDALDNKREVGFTFRPIGYVESPFPDRRGTPRQPLLVPAAKGIIRFDKKLVQYQHFEELVQFSHIWVTFVFHENTNTEKSSKVAKIRPPRLHGAKVGCLTTRSPHRPNEIGLSVCEIASVGKDYIEVRCLDMVHGTPVLDIKPYIPYDVIPSPYALPMARSAENQPLIQRPLTVPAWIVDSDISLRPVTFSPQASAFLESAVSRKFLQYVHSVSECVEFITQVLRQDVRGVHQGRGEAMSEETVLEEETQREKKSESETGTESSVLMSAESLYQCRLDCMDISFITRETEIFVHSIQAIV